MSELQSVLRRAQQHIPHQLVADEIRIPKQRPEIGQTEALAED